VRSYETSVNIYQATRRHIPEDIILHATFDDLSYRLLIIYTLAYPEALVYEANANISVQNYDPRWIVSTRMTLSPASFDYIVCRDENPRGGINVGYATADIRFEKKDNYLLKYFLVGVQNL
jgi:hypothetical protein